MEEKNISKELCKNCGTKLSVEDTIFDGYCEKCYNKWVNKKVKKSKKFNEYFNQSLLSTLSCLLGIFSIGIITAIFILFIIHSPIIFLNAISLFQITGLSTSINEAFFVINKLMYASIFFEIIGVILGIISIKKCGKNTASITGIILSIISAIFIFCVGIIIIALS